MKKQTGFIQIPLLIAIIASVLVLGGTGYFGYKQFIIYQTKQAEQQKQLEKNQKEIGALQKSVQQTSSSVQLQQKPKLGPRSMIIPPQSSNISAQDIATYLSGVVDIFCWDDSESGIIVDRGSGTLRKVAIKSADGTIRISYSVLTNKYVLGSSNCSIGVNQDLSQKNWRAYLGGQYQLSSAPLFFGKADASLIKIDAALTSSSQPISELNYSVGDLRHCQFMSVGSQVYVIGYPSYGVSILDGGGKVANQIATEGTISGYDTSGGLGSSVNYFVTAKMDTGNSGGAAIAKDSKGLCFLGIPTWVSEGTYANTGIVQNINNIFYQK